MLKYQTVLVFSDGSPRSRSLVSNSGKPDAVLRSPQQSRRHTFSRHTVQRKRCHFKVYVNDYWGVPRGTYHDNDNNKKRMLRTPESVHKFMRLHDYYDRRATQNSYN